MHGVFDTIDNGDFLSLVKIVDKRPTDLQKLPATFIPQIAAKANTEPADKSPVIYIFEQGGQIKSGLVR